MKVRGNIQGEEEKEGKGKENRIGHEGRGRKGEHRGEEERKRSRNNGKGDRRSRPLLERGKEY